MTACNTRKAALPTLPVLATVDLVRTKTNGSAWHITAGDTTTLCHWQIPDAAVHEDGLDARVVSHRGRVVCSRCRKAISHAA